MEKMIVALALGFFAIVPLTLAAEGDSDAPVVKKHVIVAGADDIEVTEIIERAKALAHEAGGADGDGPVKVIVMKDDDGNVEVEKIVTGEGMFATPAMPPMHGVHRMKAFGIPHGMQSPEPMNEATANCVLKNIRNAASDHAAVAVVRACRALNP